MSGFAFPTPIPAELGRMTDSVRNVLLLGVLSDDRMLFCEASGELGAANFDEFVSSIRQEDDGSWFYPLPVALDTMETGE